MWYLFHVHALALSVSVHTLHSRAFAFAHQWHIHTAKHNFALRKQLLCCRLNYLYKTIVKTQQELQNNASRDDVLIKLFPLESRFPFSPFIRNASAPVSEGEMRWPFPSFSEYFIYIMSLVVARDGRQRRCFWRWMFIWRPCWKEKALDAVACLLSATNSLIVVFVWCKFGAPINLIGVMHAVPARFVSA
jgi:hypothetical protein